MPPTAEHPPNDVSSDVPNDARARFGARLRPNSTDRADLLSAANAAADAARVAALRHFRRVDLDAEDKGGAAGYDPVTQGDRETEAVIRAVLAKRRPGDAIQGEEHDDTDGDSGVTWVIDPIDGTRSYMSGAPTWGVLIAAADADGPVVGLIDQPHIGERYVGDLFDDASAGAFYFRGADKRRLRTRACARIEDAVLFTTFPEIGSAQERAAFERVKARAKLTRYGLDCYAYALLAAGHIDLVIEAGLQAYDVQALMPVIQAAGGIITGWDGGDCRNGGRILAAGDPALHAQAMALLAECGEPVSDPSATDPA